MRAAAWSFGVSLTVSMFIVLFALFGCAGRSESMVYTPDTLPPWIVKEWRNAQDELLMLPDIPGDPRRISPYQFEWVQLEQPFYYTVKQNGQYSRERLFGVYDHDTERKQIIVCCGRKKTVRHEAVHAILHVLGDPRYQIHYPEFKEMLK